MIQLGLFLLFVPVAGLMITAIVRTPKSFRDRARHVFICCAHSDDCIITGAEYAYGALKSGLSVRIVYLTCSAPQPACKIAETRAAEALSAWSALNVPPEHLTFLGLSESPVAGPASYTDKDIERVATILRTIVSSLPLHAAVIIPAVGESHVDHRKMRCLSLRTIIESEREDLIVYESPEYNECLSFVQGPIRATLAIVRHLPLLNRAIRPYSGRSNYVSGPPGAIFRDTSERLTTKRALLRHFTSQNGERLAQSFGYPTLYRTVPLRTPPRASGRYFPAFGAFCDISTLFLAIVIFSLLFAASYKATTFLLDRQSTLGHTVTIVPYLGLAVSAAYFWRRLRGTVSIETALFVWTGALGMVAALF